jgi:hypothetical protein
MMSQINAISAIPDSTVYRRKDGSLYLKLNEGFHVKVKITLSDGETRLLGDGCAEKLNPEEEVEVIDAVEQKTKEEAFARGSIAGAAMGAFTTAILAQIGLFTLTPLGQFMFGLFLLIALIFVVCFEKTPKS